MSTFTYKAVDAQGKARGGRLEAADTRAATLRLQDMGLIPVAIRDAAPPAAGAPSIASLSVLGLRGVSRRDILFFTEELATLLRAGLPLDRSLGITAELAARPALRAVILAVLKEIKGGRSLAEALASHPKYFSRLYINMIRAGEAGGVMNTILERLVEFERAADEMRSYLTSALIYPALLTLAGAGSIGILFYFVIPRFALIFEDAGASMPPSTAAIVALAEFTRGYWWLAAALIAGVAGALWTWLKTPAGSRTWDSFQLRIPLLGPTLLKMEISRFARTLGTLIASSVPLIAGVRIVQDIAHNQIVAEAIARIADGAKRGEGVAQPMRNAGVFPGLAVHLVGVGEETGRLDSMLLQLADVYDKDVKTSVKALTSVLEPAIILVMGLVIGFVVLSMLLTIFSINEIAF